MTTHLIEKLNLLLQQAKKDCKSGEVAELELAIAEYKTLALDAKRFNAIANSPFKLIGCAGLDGNDLTQPSQTTGKDGYAHVGCEMWTKHDGHKNSKDILIGFADQAIKAQSMEADNV